ncbi:hypothetical protein DB346_03175 [Verrucomicrobia bacterium LW23]|nr:hypothetical protein DB346_03175 [Verrucomicrobia bacterium LW23]
MSEPAASSAFDPHNIPVAVNTPVEPLPGEPSVAFVVSSLVIGALIKITVILFILFLMYVNNFNIIDWWT